MRYSTHIENESAMLALLAANYIVSDLGGYYAKSDDVEYKNISPESFVAFMRMVLQMNYHHVVQKMCSLVMAESGGDPQTNRKRKGLLQVSDPEALRAKYVKSMQANENDRC